MQEEMERIVLRVPAAERSLLAVRMTASGVLAGRGLDVETVEDLKTAVYEACYALLHQRMRPQALELCFCPEGDFAAEIRCLGRRRETAERQPDARLCRCVLEAMVPGVEVLAGGQGLETIRLWCGADQRAFGG